MTTCAFCDETTSDPAAAGWTLFGDVVFPWHCPKHTLCGVCRAVPAGEGTDPPICYDCMDRESGYRDQEDAEIEWRIASEKGAKSH